jgi:hypothetical protein
LDDHDHSSQTTRIHTAGKQPPGHPEIVQGATTAQKKRPESEQAPGPSQCNRDQPSAAKAYQQEKLRKWREDAHAAGVAADLERLAASRKYLILDRKVAIPGRDLIEAIDDYAEKLTGDRSVLHAQHHSIG